MVERARVGVGAKEDLAARVALALGDSCREQEDAGEHREVRHPLAGVRRPDRGDRLESGRLPLGKAPREWDHLEVAVDLERKRLVRKVENVTVRSQAALA